MNISGSRGPYVCMREMEGEEKREYGRDALTNLELFQNIFSQSETPSPILTPSTLLLLCRASLWADYISICIKLEISSCVLAPRSVPARGTLVARGRVNRGTELLKQVSFCVHNQFRNMHCRIMNRKLITEQVIMMKQPG